MFCRETVRRLRRLRKNDPAYPRVVLVHGGTPEQGSAFLKRHWPRVPAIADPSAALFDAFAIPRGDLKQVLGPGVFASGLRAAVRGNGLGKPAGDVWRMPGAFLVHRGHVLWAHSYRHVGYQPDYAAIPALARARLDVPPRASAG